MEAHDLLDHFESVYADQLEFRADEDQGWPDRILGYSRDIASTEARTSVIVRFVGPDNAGRYRRWITVPNAVYESMTRRPAGWRFYVLMVGLLPDGGPWWTALYDERALARPDVLPFAEAIRLDRGGMFWRFDPHLAEKALVAEFDFTQQQIDAHLFHRGTCDGCGQQIELAVPQLARS